MNINNLNICNDFQYLELDEYAIQLISIYLFRIADFEKETEKI